MSDLIMGKDDRIFRHLLAGKKDLVGAEIGTYEGEHAKLLLDNLDIKKFYLVDAYTDYIGLETSWVLDYQGAKKRALEALAQYPQVIWRYEMSETAARKIKKELDFVYIDANHAYEWVKKDIESWLPKVKSGGLVGGHDYQQRDGVTRTVEELRENYEVETKDIEWWLWKK